MTRLRNSLIDGGGEQTSRQDESQDAYWASFWDDDQVFYGHVLGFKGLERRVVVLAVNDL
ncbi:MAG: hypothetical protein WKF73_19580 [Nocardioidaceae bacterium]